MSSSKAPLSCPRICFVHLPGIELNCCQPPPSQDTCLRTSEIFSFHNLICGMIFVLLFCCPGTEESSEMLISFNNLLRQSFQQDAHDSHIWSLGCHRGYWRCLPSYWGMVERIKNGRESCILQIKWFNIYIYIRKSSTHFKKMMLLEWNLNPDNRELIAIFV